MADPEITQANILVVDDEEEHAQVMCEALTRLGHRCDVTYSLEQARNRLARTRFPVEPTDAAWQYGSNGQYMRRFIAHWRERFDWRVWEAKLNAFEQALVTLTRPDTGGPQTVHVLIERGSGPNPTSMHRRPTARTRRAPSRRAR